MNVDEWAALILLFFATFVGGVIALLFKRTRSIGKWLAPASLVCGFAALLEVAMTNDSAQDSSIVRESSSPNISRPLKREIRGFYLGMSPEEYHSHWKQECLSAWPNHEMAGSSPEIFYGNFSGNTWDCIFPDEVELRYSSTPTTELLYSLSVRINQKFNCDEFKQYVIENFPTPTPYEVKNNSLGCVDLTWSDGGYEVDASGGVRTIEIYDKAVIAADEKEAERRRKANLSPPKL
jgi:hypothetical protein